MSRRVINLSTTESVVIEQSGASVALELHAFGLKLARRALTKAQAREIGDALGFASNDIPPVSAPAAQG